MIIYVNIALFLFKEEIYKQRETQWQTEYNKLYKAYEKLEKETLDRDYEEFKAPDTNNDDMISRAEFNTYVKKYLSSFPELSERDFPRFEEFDLDGDGIQKKKFYFFFKINLEFIVDK